jgi:hypothetical protein
VRRRGGTIYPLGREDPYASASSLILADQHRRAGQALTSEPLEDWQRYSLPSFTERMRTRLRTHCQEDHQSWPAKGRYTPTSPKLAAAGGWTSVMLTFVL